MGWFPNFDVYYVPCISSKSRILKIPKGLTEKEKRLFPHLKWGQARRQEKSFTRTRPERQHYLYNCLIKYPLYILSDKMHQHLSTFHRLKTVFQWSHSRTDTAVGPIYCMCSPFRQVILLFPRSPALISAVKRVFACIESFADIQS